MLCVSLYVEGSGPAVLVLQGGPGLSSRSVAPICELLRDHFRVIRFDHSYTSINGFIDRIETVRHEIGEDRWFVVGHSWGAAMAALYAGAHPERAQAIVLAHPMEISSEYNDAAEHSGDQEHAGAEDLQTDLAEALWEDLQTRCPDAAEEGYDLSSAARQITVPAMVLLGDLDSIDRRSGLRWAELANARLVALPDCGHWSFLEQPHRFQQTVAEFLQARPAVRAMAAA
jgi:pimeloyl-ACP methyl ester carboxylesterase